MSFIVHITFYSINGVTFSNYCKRFCCFLTNQAARFISRGIGCSYFSRNFLLSFLLWYDFEILVKSTWGGTFLCLASSASVWQKHFFCNWKLNIPSFIFLIWTGKICSVRNKCENLWGSAWWWHLKTLSTAVMTWRHKQVSVIRFLFCCSINFHCTCNVCGSFFI